MITVSVLAILTMGVIPLVQVTVKRQKEQQLRDTLRQMREAIDQFHREALAGANYQPNQQVMSTADQERAPRLPPNQNPQGGGVNMFADRFTIDRQPRWKNGNPPHRTTGVANSSSSHRIAVAPNRCSTDCQPIISSMRAAMP